LLDYSLSKGALQTMSRNLANAHAADGVRINHLNVGWVLTDREHAMQVREGQPADWVEHLPAVFAPSGRLLAPEEIAAAAIPWLSDELGPVSGSVLELEQYPVIGRNPVKS
jgi:NAD(P)-dependent dehydrogenase (short-subunit alcohol dehydrogenase family)